MQSNRRVPLCTLALSFVTICLTILAALQPKLFTLLAMWSQPEHWWQYASGIFIHAIEPAGFWAIHLGLNLLGLLPLGILLEKRIGTKRCVSLLLLEWLITVVLFHSIHIGERTYAVGISTIVYAFAAAAAPHVWKKLHADDRKLWKQPLFYYAVFEYFGLLSMLNPANGLSTLLLHASGLVTGVLFCAFQRSKNS